MTRLALALAASTALLATAADAQSRKYRPGGGASDPAVVVTIENGQPSRGAFLTPVWIGLHDGSFDTHDLGQPASVPLGGRELEAVAEDGNNGPISDTFAFRLPDAPQIRGLAGPSGPLAPGDTAGATIRVDPASDRYFSYASMILPSNDFFVANDDPFAIELFDESGAFVARDFTVTGELAADAGTEVNDEIASNVAFLGQSAPDTGVTENGVVTAPTDGFAPPGTFTFPNGVLNHPVVGLAQFNTPDDDILRVSFQFVDFARRVRFRAPLSADQVEGSVNSDASGRATLVSRRGNSVVVRAWVGGLSGPITSATLNLGRAGSNGPVVATLGGAQGSDLTAQITASDISDAFGGDFSDFLGEMAAGNVYLNLGTAANPDGEVRGQVGLAPRR